MPELDWKNPDDYDYLAEFNLHEWAWEFLRRNPEYREAYFALEASATKAKFREAQEDPVKWEAFRALHIAATEPWGLRMPANPRFTYREAFPNFVQQAGVQMPPSWTAPEAEEGDLWPGYPHTVVLQFDLHYSVEIQIQIAAERLRRFGRHIAEAFNYQPIAPKTKQYRKGQFPLYVRILDAELAGATIGQMSRELFRGTEDQRGNLKSMRATAQRMSRKDYRDLLLLPPWGG